jgi:vacuolar-type H+-ATPase subunit F/Vma7
MIVLGNRDFSTGMLLAGVKKSFIFENRTQIVEILKNLSKDEFIIANASVIEAVPELEQFSNVVSIPDKVEDFGKIDDLQHIIKSVVGIELEV